MLVVRIKTGGHGGRWKESGRILKKQYLKDEISGEVNERWADTKMI